MLPLKAAYFLAERCSDLQYFFSAKDRDAVAQNLHIILKKDISECRIFARKVFRNFGLYLVDFFRMPRITQQFIDTNVQIIGMDNIDRVLKEGKGGILLTCHIGNWEMGGVIAAMKGYNIHAVALSHKHKDINNFFISQREKKGMKVITMTDSTIRQCINVLQNSSLLALVGDRDFMNNGIMVNFFGVPTSIPKGPGMLALKTNSPIIPGIFIREGRFNYKLILDTPIYVTKEQNLSYDEIIRNATVKFIGVLEGYILKHPDQWLVFRKFWESPVDVFVL